MDDVELLIDGSRAELEEKAGQRAASRSPIEPQDDWIVLGIVPRLKEPYLRSLAGNIEQQR